MKTPKCEYNEEDIPHLALNLNENIIHLYKMKEKFLEYLYNKDIIIKLELDYARFSFALFYFLDILITYESYVEIINFTYDFDFIKNAYKFLVKKPKNKIRQIIGIKIIDDLIYNYKNSVKEEEYSKYEKKIEKIKTRIQELYENTFSKNEKIAKELDLPEDLVKLDTKEILLKIITDLFNNSNFEDYENINSLIITFDIDSIFIDEDIIDEIKNIINSDEFHNKFLLTKEDLNYLENHNIKMELNFQKKINLLYILIVEVLNEPSNIEDFPFLLNTSSLLDNFFKEKGKDEILSKLDKGIRSRFSKIIVIFENNKSLLSSDSTKTKSSSVKVEKKKQKKEKNTRTKKNYNKKDIQNVLPKERVISKFFDIIIHTQKFIYDIETLKIFEMIKSYSSNIDELLGKIYNEHYPIKEINLIPKKEKGRLYNNVYNLIDNLKYVYDEFRYIIDYEVIIKENDDIIILAIRCEDMIYLFYLEKSDSLLNKIHRDLNV